MYSENIIDRNIHTVIGVFCFQKVVIEVSLGDLWYTHSRQDLSLIMSDKFAEPDAYGVQGLYYYNR
jgi:hypothetical protein